MSGSLSGLYGLKEAVAADATVPPAVTNDSPTDELTDANELAKTDGRRAEDIKRKRAANLLSLTFNKLDKLIHLKSPDFAKFDSLQYFTENYYKAMGFGSNIGTSQYKDDIGNVKIYDMVKKFIDNITYKGTTNDPYTFTLHDAIGFFDRVSQSNPRYISEPSDYCKARDIFIRILRFIKDNVTTFEDATFSYSSNSGLLKSSKVCNPTLKKTTKNVRTEKNGQITIEQITIDPITNPLDSIDPTKTSSVVLTISDVKVQPLSTDKSGGGSKSRRTRRRKHNHKTHHKRASKSHKRRRHSRVARKHKKHTRR